MANLIILHGNARRLIDNKLKSIYNSHQDSEIIVLDGDDEILDSFLNHLQMPSLFNEKKLIIVKNALFLKAGNNLFEEDDLNLIVKALENNNALDIVFVINSETIDSRKKIVKLATEIIDFNNKNINVKKWIIDYLSENGLMINGPEAELIIYRVGKDLLRLENELNKLILYKGTGDITVDDINLVISITPEETTFDLIDAIINGEKATALSLTNNLIEQGEEVVKLYITLANQYRLMLEVSLYKNQGLKPPEIASRMQVHPYRVQLAISKLNKYDEVMLRNALHDLYELDVKNKTINCDKEIAFKEWLLKT